MSVEAPARSQAPPAEEALARGLLVSAARALGAIGSRQPRPAAGPARASPVRSVPLPRDAGQKHDDADARGRVRRNSAARCVASLRARKASHLATARLFVLAAKFSRRLISGARRLDSLGPASPLKSAPSARPRPSLRRASHEDARAPAPGDVPASHAPGPDARSGVLARRDAVRLARGRCGRVECSPSGSSGSPAGR